jgi:cytidylate kinase
MGEQAMAVVAVYKSFATGGRELGRNLAKKLGYDYVDKSLFQKVAEALDVSEGTLESFEHGRMYRVSNLFSNLFSKSYIQRIVGYDKTVVEEKEYQRSLEKLILGVAQQDNAVIIGRASYYFLKDMPGCYRFRLVAPIDWRKNYAMKMLSITEAQAQSEIARRDRNQAWFHRAVCGENYHSPLMFHLTINSSLIPLEEATGIVLSVVHSGEKG